MWTLIGWAFLAIFALAIGYLIWQMLMPRVNPERNAMIDIVRRLLGPEVTLCPEASEIMECQMEGRPPSHWLVDHISCCESCLNFEKQAILVEQRSSKIRRAIHDAQVRVAQQYDGGEDQMDRERPCPESNDILTAWYVIEDIALTADEHEHRAECWHCRQITQALASRYAMPVQQDVDFGNELGLRASLLNA